ncbi:MAG: Virulence sensor protein BvgS precursor [Syntrophus sp. PtaB.Bin001]|nr:MAG: Virulence sensor protein BvgS precursor [Syntrophus sp. PtaB.Bin001]
MQRILEARIAEQKRLEAELAEQVRFLQTLIDNIPNPIFYKDLEGLYLGCNKAFEEYFAVRREEILGKRVQDIRTADQIDVHYKVDAELIQTGGRTAYESTIRPEDGSLIHVITHKALFHRADGNPSGIVATITDITDHKQAEDALRTSEEKFLKAFQSNPTMMAISTLREGIIVEVNESYLQNSGFTRQEVVGKTSRELNVYFHPEQREFIIKMIMEKGSVRNLDVPMRRKDGNIINCLYSAERISLKNVDHILVLMQDITDRKRAEEERLQRMRLQSVLDTAGTICHEFNQPMQILSGYTDLLLSGSATDVKTREKLLSIKEQTARMEMITRKLLAIKDCSVQDYVGIGKIMDIHQEIRELPDIKKRKNEHE